MLACATVALPISSYAMFDSIHDNAIAAAETDLAVRLASSGFPALDLALPNQCWPASTLIELLLTGTENAEWNLLAPSLAALTKEGKQVILMGPTLPCPSLLQNFGLDLRYVRLVQAEQPADRLWTIQHALNSADFGALLCWLPYARDDHLRRLQAAATACDGLIFALRPATCRYQSSPAPLRLVCGVTPDSRYGVQMIKRRGPVQHQPVMISQRAMPQPAALPTQVPPVARISPLRKRSPHGAAASFGIATRSRAINAR